MVGFTVRGLVPPVFTPLKADMSIDLASIKPYMEHLVKNNIRAILVNGTTGEGPSLSVVERKKLTEAWVAAAKPHNMHIMVQVGGAPFPDVLELARFSASLHVDSLLALPELYFKPSCADDLVSYVERIGREAPNTPLLYYHIPAFSGVSLNMAEFIRAATKRVPNFKGIKFTSNDLGEGADALAACVEDQTVFLGADTLWAAAQLHGFDSAIGTTLNMVPDLARDITAAIEGNDVQEARALQRKLNQFIAVLTAEGPWVTVMKAGMELVTGVKVGPPRFPLVPLADEQIARVCATFKSNGFIK